MVFSAVLAVVLRPVAENRSYCKLGRRVRHAEVIRSIVAFAAAVVSFVLIRERDFVTAEEDEEQTDLAVAA